MFKFILYSIFFLGNLNLIYSQTYSVGLGIGCSLSYNSIVKSPKNSPYFYTHPTFSFPCLSVNGKKYFGKWNINLSANGLLLAVGITDKTELNAANHRTIRSKETTLSYWSGALSIQYNYYTKRIGFSPFIGYSLRNNPIRGILNFPIGNTADYSLRLESYNYYGRFVNNFHFGTELSITRPYGRFTMNIVQNYGLQKSLEMVFIVKYKNNNYTNIVRHRGNYTAVFLGYELYLSKRDKKKKLREQKY